MIYLGWLGGQPVSLAYEVDSAHTATFYFGVLLLVGPLVERLENALGRG